MPRLLVLSASHDRLPSGSATPPTQGGRRPSRSPPGGSTFTTSAPRSPRILPARKPDSFVRSRTRSPDSTAVNATRFPDRSRTLCVMRVQDLFSLSGRVALVTGGGRGIGRHVAIGLAEAGARVFVASRKRAACEAVAAVIRTAGGTADALEADVADPAQCEQLIAQVVGAAERLDVLVNNAARVWAAPTLDYPLDGWDRVFALNVRGLFVLTQLAARQMA